MRKVVCSLVLLLLGSVGPAMAANCVVELSGSYRCDDGTVLKPGSGGSLRAERGGAQGTTLLPDGTGGFRGEGQQLRPNGYGGLSTESEAAGRRAAQFPGVPDQASGLRVGNSGYAAPLPNRDCRQDAFGGFRCR